MFHQCKLHKIFNSDLTTEMTKKLSTLSTHKIMLTLMNRQRPYRVHAAHKHVRSIYLRLFVLLTLACQGNAVRICACLSVFPAWHVHTVSAPQCYHMGRMVERCKVFKVPLLWEGKSVLLCEFTFLSEKKVIVLTGMNINN